MKSLKKILFMLFVPVSYCVAQQGNIAQRIFLVGNAGEMKESKQPVCDWLKQHVDWNDTKNVLIYLGNNIYPVGMPDEGSKNYTSAQTVFDYQLSVVQDKKASAFFVPGNNDWKGGKAGGLEQVRNEWRYVNSLQLPNVQVMPANGCPGPVDIQAGDKVVIVFMDSQWWLQQGERTGEESNCDFKTEEEVIFALNDIIGTYPDKLILLAMHHPFYSYGKHPRYKNLISQVEEIMKKHHNIIQAAGHDENLQFLVHDSIPFIVSGSGSGTSKVKMGKNSLFARKENGFAMVEVTNDGKVAVKFYNLKSSDLEQPIFSAALNSLITRQPDAIEVVKSFQDSVTVIASGKFKSSVFKNFLLGKNYREEWKTPVRVRVMNIGKEFGGLTPVKRGGGHQTKSLRLEDPNETQYVLRLVEKSVTDAALPPDLRGTAAKDLISDGVSASYPYAALSVPTLAIAADVPHTNPELVYIPDDPRLGKYRTDFGNSFCLLEERVSDPTAKKTYSTDEMVDKLHGDNDNLVDQKAMLQVRLLDMFMMDFDRHEDQWLWAAKDNGKGKTFYPLPRDRDQAFFINKGLLPSIARKPWIGPQVQGFRSKAINIKTYNFNARSIDRAFINELSEDDWKKMTDEFLSKMTDEVIEKSLHQQPKEIQVMPRNQEIIQKLKDRKKYYTDEMMEYYHFLAKIVNVTGSDKKELFDITRYSDGSVLVQVYKITKEGEQSKKIYERKFDPAYTKEIRLYAMGGNDKFVTHGDGNKITIRMIGGSGKDVFENNATSPAGKNLAYDLNTEANQVTGNIRQKLSDDPAVNKYERFYYKYNLNITFLSGTYNPDDGLYLGASLRMIRHGFRKTPYKTMHLFSVDHSLLTKAYHFRYYSEFIGLLGKKSDLLLDARIKSPDITNYFGYGNASVYDKNLHEDIDYYRARYVMRDFSVLDRKNFSPSVSMILGPTYEYYSLDSSDNSTRYILQTGTNGLDPNTLFKKQSFAGGFLKFDFDNRNNKALPSKGIYWQSSVRALKGLNNASSDITMLKSDLAFYTSFSRQAGFVLALRFGGGHNFGNFEFYQAQSLGGTENLRGYRKFRFRGESMAYNNIEMRVKLADFRTYLFPGSLGFLAFHDVGRVWSKGDTSNKWHTGYGGGIWVSPLRRLVLTGSYAISNETKLVLVTFGWQF